MWAKRYCRYGASHMDYLTTAEFEKMEDFPEKSVLILQRWPHTRSGI